MNPSARMAGIVLLLASFAAPEIAVGQPDLAVYGERMGGEDLYGVGGSLLVPLRGYRYDVVLGGHYFFAPADTTSPWMLNLDTHLNLATLRMLRPYISAGLNYYNRDGDRLGVNLSVGTYVRFTDRFVPYAQYTYRTIPSIEHSYVQLGMRVLLRRQ